MHARVRPAVGTKGGILVPNEDEAATEPQKASAPNATTPGRSRAPHAGNGSPGGLTEGVAMEAAVISRRRDPTH